MISGKFRLRLQENDRKSLFLSGHIRDFLCVILVFASFCLQMEAGQGRSPCRGRRPRNLRAEARVLCAPARSYSVRKHGKRSKSAKGVWGKQEFSPTSHLLSYKRLSSETVRWTVSEYSRVTSPANKVTSPANNVTSPANNVTSPANKVTQPGQSHPFSSTIILLEIFRTSGIFPSAL